MSDQDLDKLKRVAATVVNEEIRTEHYKKVQGKDEAVLKKAHDEKQATMAKALEQAGDDFNIAKVDCLSGKTAQEKAQSLVKLHSEMAAESDAIQEVRGYKQLSAAIASGKLGDQDLFDRMGDADVFAGAEQLRSSPQHPAVENLEAMRHDIRMLTGGAGIGSPEFVAALKSGGLEIGAAASDRFNIMNTLFQTTDGWPPFIRRLPGYVPSAQRPIQVIDLLPTVTTDQHAIKYMEETEFTNAAAEIAEGAAAPESAFKLEEKTVAIQKIAAHVPVTEEQLEDVAQAEMYLTQRLPFQVRQRLDSQIINGNGNAPNLVGILSNANLLNEDQPYAADAGYTKPLNTILKAKTKVNYEGFAMASAFLINPSYWTELALQETASAGFYLGNPQNAFEPRMWGLPAVQTNSLADGNAAAEVPVIVGDFNNFIFLSMRRDMRLEWGMVNNDFLEGKYRLKATMRAAVVLTRGAAFAKVTIVDA